MTTDDMRIEFVPREITDEQWLSALQAVLSSDVGPTLRQEVLRELVTMRRVPPMYRFAPPPPNTGADK
jgi:hypothetical protein